MDVRFATGDDVAAVTEQWVALAREQRAHDSHLLHDENREQARDLVGQYVHADGIAVATTAGDGESSFSGDSSPIVGFVMFHVETGFFETDVTRGVVDNVYVVPDARDQGVGTALLEFAEGELADRGADVLAVEALWDNEAARRLYERRGYDQHRVTYERAAAERPNSGTTAEATNPDTADES